MLLCRLEISDLAPVPLRVLDFAPGALADVPADIDDENLIRHINLTLVHIVEHFLCPLRPDLVIARVAEEADADDDVSFEGETFLGLKELVLEARAPAEGYDFVLADHVVIFFSRILRDASTFFFSSSFWACWVQ